MKCEVLLLILQLVACYYPISVSALAQIRRPIALIISDASMIQPIIKLLGAEKSVITENMSNDKATNLFRFATIAPVICIGRNTDSIPHKVDSLWRLLIDAARLSKIDGEQLKTQIIFIFDRRIPTPYVDEFFKIYISRHDFQEAYSGIDISRFNRECLGQRVLDRIIKNCDVDDDELRAFYTVVDLAAMFDGSIDVVKLKEIAEQMVAYDEETEDIGDVTSMFRESLYAYVENSASCRAYELPNVEMSVLEQINRVMFYDAKYLYMSDELFRTVTEDMRRIFPADVIKSTLSAEDVLMCGSGRYAMKMSLVTPYGESKRPCMLKFLREKLNKLGELDLVDISKGSKEGTS